MLVAKAVYSDDFFNSDCWDEHDPCDPSAVRECARRHLRDRPTDLFDEDSLVLDFLRRL